MIRLTFLLRRREDLSVEAFKTYWQEVHGPLVAKHARTLGIERYVQVHTLDDPLHEAFSDSRGGVEPPYDGVAELWYRSRDTLIEAGASAAGRAAAQELLEDEKAFIDHRHSPLWLAHEYPQVNPTPEPLVAYAAGTTVKVCYPLRPLADLELGDAQAYWHRMHGPLIRSLAPAMKVLRYLQVHRVEDELEMALREARGVETPAYAGHAELWFDRPELARAGGTPEGRSAFAAALEDERCFVDFRRSSLWVAKERVFVDRR